jgi:hypothetical protein
MPTPNNAPCGLQGGEYETILLLKTAILVGCTE